MKKLFFKKEINFSIILLIILLGIKYTNFFKKHIIALYGNQEILFIIYVSIPLIVLLIILLSFIRDKSNTLIKVALILISLLLLVSIFF